MAVPSSTNVNGLVTRSAGFGEAFYDLLTEGKGAYEKFVAICRGGALLKEAQSISSSKKTPVGRDGFRAEVAELIRNKISESMLY
jgi:hypothetical protein